MIRVVLPHHLRTLARVEGEVRLDVQDPVTLRAVLDALEAAYPVLRGTIRDHVTLKRRPFVRFFACEQDLSHDPGHAAARGRGDRRRALPGDWRYRWRLREVRRQKAEVKKAQVSRFQFPVSIPESRVPHPAVPHPAIPRPAD